MELEIILLVNLLMIALAAAGNAGLANSLECCSRLRSLMPGQATLSGNAIFDRVNDDRWSLTSIFQPSCIVLPTYVDGVATAVKVLVGGGCPFAIKSGGYNPNSGANNIAEGISIDLRGINQTTLSADRTYVSLGAGGTWLDAYEALGDSGVAFPGGRCGRTGIGGLTLGGGISFFSSRVVFVTDNVLNFEIVLASGQTIDANASSNSDLFMALKGGSSNFGIVTRIDLATFDNEFRWGGTKYVTLQAVCNLTELAYADEYMSYVAAFQFDTRTGKANTSNTLVYTKDVAYPNIFAPLVSIQPQSSNILRRLLVSDIVLECGSRFPAGYGDLTATVTIPSDPSILEYLHQLTTGAFQTVQDVPDLEFIFIYEPLPQVYSNQGLTRGGDMLGLNSSQQDFILIKLAPRWADADYDEKIQAAASTWVQGVQELFAVFGIQSPFVYLNYANSFQDPVEGYGEANADFMNGVSKKYDPNGVFQRLVPGGFKLSQGP